MIYIELETVSDEKKAFVIFGAKGNVRVKLFRFTFSVVSFDSLPTALTIERIGEKSSTMHYKLTQSESAIFLLVKQVMNRLALTGAFPANGQHNVRWIKKKMSRDGHLTNDSCYYVREQQKGKSEHRMLAIYDPDYAIRSLPQALRVEGKVALKVENLSDLQEKP